MRPIHANAEATKARILAAARALVSEHGVDGTSMREVAAQAAVTMATVHHYFGSKEGLYAACIADMDRELALLKDELFSRVALDRPPAALVEDVVRTTCRFARAHAPAQRLLLRTVVEHGGLEVARREGSLRPLLDQAAPIVAALTSTETGKARLLIQSIIVLVARYAMASVAELRVVSGLDDDDAALQAVQDHLVDVTLRTLRLPERAGPASPDSKV